MSRREIESLKYAGFLTLSQSGDAKNLINGIITASKLGVSCINVVNVEDSPITRVIQEINIDESQSPATPSPVERRLMRSDSGDLSSLAAVKTNSMTMPNAQFYENDENIGFYMKSGFCYSDVKSFVP